jgi:hypothetical protein
VEGLLVLRRRSKGRYSVAKLIAQHGSKSATQIILMGSDRALGTAG